MNDPLTDFADFTARVRERLDAGRAAYADASFGAYPSELIDELAQECLDLAGWGFILHTRLMRAREALRASTDTFRSVDSGRYTSTLAEAEPGASLLRDPVPSESDVASLAEHEYREGPAQSEKPQPVPNVEGESAEIELLRDALENVLMATPDMAVRLIAEKALNSEALQTNARARAREGAK